MNPVICSYETTAIQLLSRLRQSCRLLWCVSYDLGTSWNVETTILEPKYTPSSCLVFSFPTGARIKVLEREFSSWSYNRLLVSGYSFVEGSKADVSPFFLSTSTICTDQAARAWCSHTRISWCSLHWCAVSPCVYLFVLISRLTRHDTTWAIQPRPVYPARYPHPGEMANDATLTVDDDYRESLHSSSRFPAFLVKKFASSVAYNNLPYACNFWRAKFRLIYLEVWLVINSLIGGNWRTNIRMWPWNPYSDISSEI